MHRKRGSKIIQLADSGGFTYLYLILSVIVSCAGKPQKMYQRLF